MRPTGPAISTVIGIFSPWMRPARRAANWATRSRAYSRCGIKERRSRDRHAAVDGERLARDEAARVAGEEHDGGGQLLGVAEAPGEHARPELALEVALLV